MFYKELLAETLSCPECKGEMKEVYRSAQGGAIFIWFECCRIGCSGQWLQRIPSSSRAASNQTNKIVASGK